MSDAELEVTLTADASDADDVLQSFAEDADELVRRFPVVKIGADADEAIDALDDVERAADDVDALDPQITPEVDAKPALDSLGRVEKAAGDAGAAGGGRFGESFIRDVGGAIDQGAAGPVADLVAAFEGGTQALGSALPSALMGPLAIALGAGGFVFIAAQKFWSMVEEGARRSAERVRDVITAQEELAQLDYTEAAKKLVDTYGDLIGKAEEYGISYETAIDIMTGRNPAALQALEDQARAIQEADDSVFTFGESTQTAMFDTVEGLRNAQGEWSKASDEIKTTNRMVEDVATSLEGLPTSQVVDLRLNDDEARRQLEFWRNLTPIRTFVKGPTLSTPTSTASTARTYESRNGPISVAP